jgi:hypothetical protein
MSEWIYSRTRDNKARFLLGEKGRRPLVCIGINPSTAEPERLDNTLSTVRRFASDLGYQGWLMLNVYPQRATDPGKLHGVMNLSYHRRNLHEIDSVFRGNRGRIDVWAAWGTIIGRRDYLSDCLIDLCGLFSRYEVRWLTIGERSIEGHPHHPLYLRKESRPERFGINGYLKRLAKTC